MALQILTTEAKLRLVGYKSEFMAAHPNIETIADPSFTGEGTAPQIPAYTDAAWLDEVIKRHIMRQLNIGDTKIKRAALEANLFDLDTE